jgi:hypothetical protein
MPPEEVAEVMSPNRVETWVAEQYLDMGSINSF